MTMSIPRRARRVDQVAADIMEGERNGKVKEWLWKGGRG
jgi:hypothetical protein